ncbi:MAG: HEPN domain-containing protein [Bacteroidales bacterium]|nr:HEPN domain-containing protein [Bacteroidales bacterium]
MNEKSKYWVEMSDYDMETARAMLATGRYLYVGFMCHQVIEKILKAYWSNVLEEPTMKIHTLSRLAEHSGIASMLTEQQTSLIDTLEPLNIEARYPSYKERLMSSLTEEFCSQLIEDTNKFQQWIKSKL